MGIDDIRINRRHLMVMLGGAASIRILPARASQTDSITPQPYFAGVKRAIEALAKLGAPIAPVDAKEIAALAQEKTVAALVKAENILDRYTLARVTLGPDGIGHATPGGAKRILVEQGWRMFLVRVENPNGNKEVFDVSTGWSPIGGSSVSPSPPVPDPLNKAPLIEKAWLMSKLADTEPLSGFPIDYRVIQLFSRDRGKHSHRFGFGAGNSSLVFIALNNANNALLLNLGIDRHVAGGRGISASAIRGWQSGGCVINHDATRFSDSPDKVDGSAVPAD